MSDRGFNKAQLLELISGLLEGGLDDGGRSVLNTVLKENPEARHIYRWHMNLHTRLHLDYAAAQIPAQIPAHMPGAMTQTPKNHFPLRWVAPAAMAAGIAILAAILWTSLQERGHFATVENVQGSRWDSGDLPTASGSRIGRGTLRLVEGMATIRFDSGAELTLEAPAELKLEDAMHCTLAQGTAVADVPESAIGFRIATPSAEVVDYGTRFSVVVDAASGSTRTQVYEGLVKVEERASGKVTSLTKGQTNATAASVPTIIGPPSRTPDWIQLETTKDAYIGQAFVDHATSGRVEVHRSETLLLLKHGTVHRKAYLGYDLAHIDPARIEETELNLHFAPTNWGVASIVPDATFSVFGLITDQPWEEKTIDEKNAPAHQIHPGASMRQPGAGPWLDDRKVRKLGSFQVGQGVQSGTFGIRGDALVSFLREHAGSGITLIVARDTPELETNGLVHGFASRRHPTLKPPTLAIRLAQP